MEQYNKKTFYKTLLTLALPISLQNLISFIVNFADNVMVGTLGDTVISGVYLGNQVHSLLQFAAGGIASAMVILCTQHWGRQGVASIRKIVAMCLRAALCVGLVFSLASVLAPQFTIGLMTNNAAVIEAGAEYLRIMGASFLFFSLSLVLISAFRSVEKVRFGLVVSVITLGTNVLLNYILIFGKLGFPAMGARGAAIATLISRILEAGVVLVYTLFVDKRLAFKLRDFLLGDRALGRDIVRFGLPVVLGEIVWAFNNFAQNAIIGRYDETVISAFSITGMMNSFAYVWLTGLTAAIGIMTGKIVGAGEAQNIKPYARQVQRMFLAVGAVTGVVVFLLRPALVSMYSITPAAQQHAMQFLTVFSVTIVGSSYQMTSLAGLVKAGGNTSFVFRNDTIFVFLVVLPSALLAMHFGAPPWVVFLCLKSDQILKCAVAAVVVNRFKWVRKLT